jgi:parafibromin
MTSKTKNPIDDINRPSPLPHEPFFYFAAQKKDEDNSRSDSPLISPFGNTMVTSKVSATPGPYPMNVSDWNERVVRDAGPNSSKPMPPSRHAADLPRLAKDGYEWVWFPEGFWAEREDTESGRSQTNSKSQGWLTKGSSRKKSSGYKSNHTSDSDKPSSTSGTASTNLTPFGKFRSKSTGPTVQTETTKTQNSQQDSEAGPVLRSLQLLSPTHPHFVSPDGELEGLYCKMKRNIGMVVKPKQVRQDSRKWHLGAKLA